MVLKSDCMLTEMQTMRSKSSGEDTFPVYEFIHMKVYILTPKTWDVMCAHFIILFLSVLKMKNKQRI